MTDLVRPAADFKAAVLPLPEAQKPYENCDMPRDVQAVMWHYGVKQEEINACLEEGYASKADFQYADPYATDAESKEMFKAIASHIKGKLPLRKLKGAISRLLAEDPFAAIVPSKKRKRDVSPPGASNAPAAVAAGASVDSNSVDSNSVDSNSTKNGSKSSSKSPKLKDNVSDSSSSEFSSDDDDGDAVADDLKESSSKASSSKSKSLDALFNSVANQVRFFDISVCFGLSYM